MAWHPNVASCVRSLSPVTLSGERLPSPMNCPDCNVLSNYIRMHTYVDYYDKTDFEMIHEPLKERTERKGNSPLLRLYIRAVT